MPVRGGELSVWRSYDSQLTRVGAMGRGWTHAYPITQAAISGFDYIPGAINSRAMKAIGDSLASAGSWLREHKGTIATTIAIAGCAASVVDFGVTIGGCAVLTGIGLGARTLNAFGKPGPTDWALVSTDVAVTTATAGWGSVLGYQIGEAPLLGKAVVGWHYSIADSFSLFAEETTP